MSRWLWLVAAAVGLVLTACGSTSSPPSSSVTPVVVSTSESGQSAGPLVRPLVRDYQAALRRYANSQPELVQKLQSEPWFRDGVDDEEALFIERSLSFVGRYLGARLDDETIDRKLYVYDKVTLKNGPVELLVVYEPGQDGQLEMRLIKNILPSLEERAGLLFPEKVLAFYNGPYPQNDFNDGQWIRIARCCVYSPFILAHEMAHAYWSVGPSWFNEGMADVYAQATLQMVDAKQPPGWRSTGATLDDYYQSQKRVVSRARFRLDLTIPRRFASDGLYQYADVFLLDLRNLIGDDEFWAVGRELYTYTNYGRRGLIVKRIEDAFLKHARPGQGQQIMDQFNSSIWGDNGETYRKYQEFDDAGS